MLLRATLRQLRCFRLLIRRGLLQWLRRGVVQRNGEGRRSCKEDRVRLRGGFGDVGSGSVGVKVLGRKFERGWFPSGGKPAEPLETWKTNVVASCEPEKCLRARNARISVRV